MRRIGVDLGGTTAKLGVVNERNEIIERRVIPTDRTRSFEEIVATLAEGALSLGPADSIGFGVPSCLRPGSDILIYANNFGWKNRDLRGELKKHLPEGLPVYIANDADAATVGEFLQGAGKGYRSMLMLTLGTGVGGGFIYEGRLFRGGDGAGIEPGHIIIHEDGQACTCGMHGCLESYCSATALIREITASDSPILQESIRAEGGKANARMLFDACAAGDPAAQEILRLYIHRLAVGVGSLVTVLKPQLVVLGGGISAAGEVLLAPLRGELAHTVYGSDAYGCPPVTTAVLGNDAGIIGAASLFTV